MASGRSLNKCECFVHVCGCFGNICTCIYSVVYCFTVFFVSFRLGTFILICIVVPVPVAALSKA
jgi:hypothetical protein